MRACTQCIYLNHRIKWYPGIINHNCYPTFTGPFISTRTFFYRQIMARSYFLYLCLIASIYLLIFCWCNGLYTLLSELEPPLFLSKVRHYCHKSVTEFNKGIKKQFKLWHYFYFLNAGSKTSMASIARQGLFTIKQKQRDHASSIDCVIFSNIFIKP